MLSWQKKWEKRGKEVKDHYIATLGSVNKELMQRMRKNVASLLQLESTDNILDVGCGRGLITSWLAERCSLVTGVDFSKEMLKRAIKKDNVTYVYAKATNLPFKNNSFDKAFCYNVLHYLNPYEAKAALKEMARVTKRSGIVLVGHVLDKDCLNPIIKSNFFNFLRGGEFYYSRKELIEIGSSVGLENCKTMDGLSKNRFNFLAIKG